MTNRAIAYYRVSTARQGASGLGLEAQRASVMAYAQNQRLDVVQELTEIETGTRKKQRPIIAQALKAAKETGAVLLIAKLDRLARNVHFISGLMESGVNFVAVDMPTVTPLTLHVLAAVAEQEAVMISQRTKAALQAAKARGTELGNPDNLTPEAQQAGARANRTAAVNAYQKTVGYARLLRQGGLSFGAVANRLNDEGHTTRKGKHFQSMTVKRMLERVALSVS